MQSYITTIIMSSGVAGEMKMSWDWVVSRGIDGIIFTKILLIAIFIIRKFNINFKLVKITWRHLNLILQKVWLFFFRRWLNFQRRYFLPWSSIACFVSWRHLYCPEWREDNYHKLPQTFSTIFSGINAVDKVGTHLGNVLAIRNSTRIHYCIHVTSIHTSNS